MHSAQSASDRPLLPGFSQAVQEYETRLPIYHQAVQKFKRLLKDECRDRGIQDCFVKGRAKDTVSFAEKLQRPGKNYSEPLKDIRDLVGLRVIVPTRQHIRPVCEVIGVLFAVISAEDKLDSLDSDRFGYQSVHLECKVRENQSKLFEWNPYRSLHFEVQVRTQLQDVWANLSHKVKYKRLGGGTKESDRRLARLSALLELADLELDSLAAVGIENPVQSQAWVKNLVESSAAYKEVDHLVVKQAGGIDFANSPLCIRIVKGARSAGVGYLAPSLRSTEKLSKLWCEISGVLRLDVSAVLRRMEPDAEAKFKIVIQQMRRRYSVDAWRANDAQILASATLIGLGDPKQHWRIARKWPKGFLQVLTCAMDRVA